MRVTSSLTSDPCSTCDLSADLYSGRHVHRRLQRDEDGDEGARLAGRQALGQVEHRAARRRVALVPDQQRWRVQPERALHLAAARGTDSQWTVRRRPRR